MTRLRAALVFALMVASVTAWATVTSPTRTQTFSPAVPTTKFTITFSFNAADQIRVTKTTIATGAQQVLTRCSGALGVGCDFTVNAPVGTVLGYVTTAVSVTNTHTLLVERSTPKTQTTSFATQGPFLPDAIEKAVDKLEYQIQEISVGAASSTTVDAAIATHSAAADPHTGYFLLSGRSGGQTAIGGTGAGDSAVIKSTSNVTKGKVYLGSDLTELVVDDVNNRIGIGTAAPSVELDVAGEVVAEANTANAAGATFTGNGTGQGVKATGGATNGAGVRGVGGTTNGHGVSGQGTGTGSGLIGLGGTDGPGVNAEGGSAALVGGYILSQPDSSVALYAEGAVSATNGNGVEAVGNGTGYGVLGSADSGYGVWGSSTTGNGVRAQGDTSIPTNAALLIVPQDTDPSSGDKGEVYVNSGDGSLRHYDGAHWERHPGYIVLASDVTDSAGNGTYTDLTGLSFAVTSGTTYNFRAYIIYDSAATTTGLGLAANGPATSRLGYRIRTGLTASTELIQYLAAYDAAGAVATDAPFTTANEASIEGTLTPSANGTFTLRFCTEVNTSLVTIKAGSTLEWWAP